MKKSLTKIFAVTAIISTILSNAVYAAPKRGEKIGTFRVTAYTNYTRSGKYKNIPTAKGMMPKANHTVATNWKEIPAGSKIMIGDSDIVYTVEDTGNFTGLVDIYMGSYSAMQEWGMHRLPVYRVIEE